MNHDEATASDATVPTLVEVWAPTCSVCRAMDPDLDAAAGRYAGRVAFERFDATADIDRARAMRVYATPTILGYLEGDEVFRSTGRLGADDIDGVFDALSSGQRPDLPSRGHQMLLGFGASAALIGAGAFLGPSVGLIVIGGVVAGITGASALWMRRGSGGRPLLR
jgi:thioredoxin 1